MQRVFITGASSGIGAALAREYASQGAVLGLVARRRDVLEQLAASLPGDSHVHLYVLDVNDHAALAEAAGHFLDYAGGIDVVIANAGISYGTLTQHPEDLPVFAQIVATNLVAVSATFTAFLPTMKAQAVAGSSACRLVGVASVAGVRGLPGAGAYSASKAAVARYCESLRVELKDSGIRVVTLVPGYIDTPMTQVNAYPMPFLLSAERFATLAVPTIARGSAYRVIPWQMGWVARLLACLPRWLYDLAFKRAPHKARCNQAVENEVSRSNDPS